MSSNESRLPAEPPLSPDFATRVIHRADIILARRRQARRLITAVAAASAIAIVIGLRVAPAPHVSSAPMASYSESEPDFLADFDRGWSSSSSSEWSSDTSQSDQEDALNYLFPDAAPLARFVKQYSASTDGIGIDEEALPSQRVEESDELL